MKQLLKTLPKLVACMWLLTACNADTDSSANGDSTMSTQNIRDTLVNASDSAGVVRTPLTNDANVVIDDNGFIGKNITDNEVEVELATIGTDRLSTPALKKAAAQIKKDHTQMLDDLRTLAAKKQVTVPATNTTMSAMTSLPTTTGKDFDIAWLNQIQEMHQAKITELENVLKQTNDADVKALATKALPVRKKHIDMLASLGL